VLQETTDYYILDFLPVVHSDRTQSKIKVRQLYVLDLSFLWLALDLSEYSRIRDYPLAVPALREINHCASLCARYTLQLALVLALGLPLSSNLLLEYSIEYSVEYIIEYSSTRVKPEAEN